MKGLGSRGKKGEEMGDGAQKGKEGEETLREGRCTIFTFPSPQYTELLMTTPYERQQM